VSRRPCRLASLLVLLLASALLVACGDGESAAPSREPDSAAKAPVPTPPATSPSDPGTPEPADPAVPSAPRKIDWVEGFAAGAQKAKDDDELLFVYVGRYKPT
jgi:hypothetical protein